MKIVGELHGVQIGTQNDFYFGIVPRNSVWIAFLHQGLIDGLVFNSDPHWITNELQIGNPQFEDLKQFCQAHHNLSK